MSNACGSRRERRAFQKHKTSGRGCPENEAKLPQLWVDGGGQCWGDRAGKGPGSWEKKAADSTKHLQFTARGLTFNLWAVRRDGWVCPSNASKVTQMPLSPSASKSQEMEPASQDSLFPPRCQSQRLLISTPIKLCCRTLESLNE